MGTKITFKRPDGKDASGYLAAATRPKRPGLVVIQEWWGLQDQIKGMCERFADAGYQALAPDLYAGTVVPYHDTEAANREMSSLNFLEATDQVVPGAAQYLKATIGRKVDSRDSAWAAQSRSSAPCAYLNSAQPSASMVFRLCRSRALRIFAFRCRRISPIRTIGARRKPWTISRQR